MPLLTGAAAIIRMQPGITVGIQKGLIRSSTLCHRPGKRGFYFLMAAHWFILNLEEVINVLTELARATGRINIELIDY